MIKAVVILYLVCLACYIPFSRTPDYFDSEKVPGLITRHDNQLMVIYTAGNQFYTKNVTYAFRRLKHGDKVTVIYDTSYPARGELYRVWGYWLTLKEVVFSAALMIVLFLAAVFITGKNSNIPYTNEELRKKPKYDL